MLVLVEFTPFLSFSFFPIPLYPYTLLSSTKNIYLYKYIYYIFSFYVTFSFLKTAKKGIFRGKQPFACFCFFLKQPFACFLLAHYKQVTKRKQPFACFSKIPKQPFACFACFCLFFIIEYRVSWRRQPACSCQEPLRISVWWKAHDVRAVC